MTVININLFLVNVRGLPFGITEGEVVEFFARKPKKVETINPHYGPKRYFLYFTTLTTIGKIDLSYSDNIP